MLVMNHHSAWYIRVGVPGPRVEGVCRYMWELRGLERSEGAGEWRVGWEEKI